MGGFWPGISHCGGEGERGEWEELGGEGRGRWGEKGGGGEGGERGRTGEPEYHLAYHYLCAVLHKGGEGM